MIVKRFKNCLGNRSKIDENRSKMGSESELFQKLVSRPFSEGSGDDFGSHGGSQMALQIDSRRHSDFFFFMISGGGKGGRVLGLGVVTTRVLGRTTNITACR